MATVTGPVQIHNRKLTDGYTIPKATTKTTPATNPTGGDVNTPGSWIGSGKPKKSPVTHGVDLSYDIYSDAMGTLNQSNTQRKQTYGAFDDMLGNYDYDEAALRAKFDAATKAEYAAKRLANEQAQADFADKLGDVTTSAMDINRANLANAVANGYSRGTLAAQQYGAMLGVQQESIADASKLVQEKRQLVYDEAAALAKNAIEAEQTTQARIKDAATLLAEIYGYDANAIGSALYSAISGAGNVFGVNKTVQSDFRNQDTQRDINTANNVNDYSIASMQNGTDVLDAILSNGGNVDVKALTDYIGKLGLTDSNGKPITVNSFTRYTGSSYGSGGSGSGGRVTGVDFTNVDPTNLSAYVSNGKWNGDGYRVLEQGQYQLDNQTIDETVRGVLTLGGVTAQQVNTLIPALQNGKARLFTKSNGNFVLALDPAATEGLVSRKDREDKAFTNYGTHIDPETLSSWDDTAKLFNYKGVVILGANGSQLTGNNAAKYYTECINKHMADYEFWRSTDGRLWCQHKDF